MILSVYGVDAAFTVVRLNAGSVVDGRTSGYRVTNRVAAANTMVAAVPRKASPSRPAREARTPPTRQTAASKASAQVIHDPSNDWVQIKKTAANATVTPPNGRTSARARSRTGPWVFNARKIAPCRAKR